MSITCCESGFSLSAIVIAPCNAASCADAYFLELRGCKARRIRACTPGPLCCGAAGAHAVGGINVAAGPSSGMQGQWTHLRPTLLVEHDEVASIG